MLTTDSQLVPACIGENIHQEDKNFGPNTKYDIGKQQRVENYILELRWTALGMDSLPYLFNVAATGNRKKDRVNSGPLGHASKVRPLYHACR